MESLMKNKEQVQEKWKKRESKRRSDWGQNRELKTGDLGTSLEVIKVEPFQVVKKVKGLPLVMNKKKNERVVMPLL